MDSEKWALVFEDTARCGMYANHERCRFLHSTGGDPETITGKNGRRQTLVPRTFYCRYGGGCRKIGALLRCPSWCPRLREAAAEAVSIPD